MNFMLKITEDLYDKVIITDAGFAETALFGLEILLLGMGAVFSVLCLIWGCLSIFSIAFTKSSKKPAKSEAAVTEVQSAPVQSASAQSEELVAVIAAAIAMAESESNGTKFTVVSFRRK